MHKVTITTSVASVLFVLTASSFPEICNRRKVQNNGPPCIKTPTQSIQSSGGMLFFSKLHVHITDHVISKVVANI
jgi:hypothetical protein